jgi:hypothetical protein
MNGVYEGKYADATTVLWLWRKITSLFVRKDGNKVLSDNNYTTEEKNKLATVEANANHYVLPQASQNELGGIKLGSGLSMDQNGVVSTVVNPSATISWDQIRNTPSTLAGYGITDAATKAELEAFNSEFDRYWSKAELEALTNAEIDDIISTH